MAHKFSTGWAVGVVKSVEKMKSGDGQFAVKYESEVYCWAQKVNKEDYGVETYCWSKNNQGRLRGTQVQGTSGCGKRVNTDKHSCVDMTNLAG